MRKGRGEVTMQSTVKVRVVAILDLLLVFVGKHADMISISRKLSKSLQELRDNVASLSGESIRLKWRAIQLDIRNGAKQASVVASGTMISRHFKQFRLTVSGLEDRTSRKSPDGVRMLEAARLLLTTMSTAEEHVSRSEFTKALECLVSVQNELETGYGPLFMNGKLQSRTKEAQRTGLVNSLAFLVSIVKSRLDPLVVPKEVDELTAICDGMIGRGQDVEPSILYRGPRPRTPPPQRVPNLLTAHKVTIQGGRKRGERVVTGDGDSGVGMMISALAKLDTKKSHTRDFLEREVWQTEDRSGHSNEQDAIGSLDQKCTVIADCFGTSAALMSFAKELRRRKRASRNSRLGRKFDALERELDSIDVKSRVHVKTRDKFLQKRSRGMRNSPIQDYVVSFLSREVSRLMNLVERIGELSSSRTTEVMSALRKQTMEDLRVQVERQYWELASNNEKVAITTENASKTAKHLDDRQVGVMSKCRLLDEELLILTSSHQRLIADGTKTVTVQGATYSLEQITEKIGQNVRSKRRLISDLSRVERNRAWLLENLASTMNRR